MTTVPTNAAVLVLAGILGLAVGSFLNVVIHRVPRSLSVVRPPSACPTCSMTLRPWHNVPVLSWLVLRGRCAGCDTGISARYPVVEALTGVLFVLVTLRFGVTPALPAYLYLAVPPVLAIIVAFLGSLAIRRSAKKVDQVRAARLKAEAAERKRAADETDVMRPFDSERGTATARFQTTA